MRKQKLHINISLVYFVYLAVFKGFEVANCVINKKIIIVGAGPSGIAAASKLYENGFTNITILEAGNRIGGRLYTTKLGDYWVDLGAQWVHGVKGNTAFKLGYPLGLLDTQNVSRYDHILYDSAGNVVSNNINKKFIKFIEKFYRGGSFQYNVVNEKSYGEYMHQAFVHNLKDVPEIIHDKEKYLHYLERLILSVDPANSWNDLPAPTSDGLVRAGYEGDQHVNWKTRGFGRILDILMKNYPEPGKELPVKNNTILNSEVTSINYSDSKNNDVTVATKDGQTYTAEHVIVTVPLGVLKERHHSLFTPSLPEEKVKVIEGLDFGCFGKVFLLFEKPFWQKDNIKTIINGFLWSDNERKVIEQNPEEMWVLGVVAQPVEHKSNVLEMFISSSKYVKAMEKVREEKVLNQSIKLLERFMGKTHNISKPIAMIRTQWSTNPHFRGAYSYRGLDTKERKVNANMLAQPVTPQNLKILFAGEATSLHRYGTADGAIDSGWAAAEKLIEFYKTASI